MADGTVSDLFACVCGLAQVPECAEPDGSVRDLFACVCGRCGAAAGARSSPRAAICEAILIGWVGEPDPSRDWRYQRICRACKIEDELFPFVFEHVVLCDAIEDMTHADDSQCRRLARFKVVWSDRRMCVCEDHLQLGKDRAAHDGVCDRTDNPRVSVVSQSDFVEKHWSRLLELYDVSPIYRSIKRKPRASGPQDRAALAELPQEAQPDEPLRGQPDSHDFDAGLRDLGVMGYSLREVGVDDPIVTEWDDHPTPFNVTSAPGAQAGEQSRLGDEDSLMQAFAHLIELGICGDECRESILRMTGPDLQVADLTVEQVMHHMGWTEVWYAHPGLGAFTNRWHVGVQSGKDSDLICIVDTDRDDIAELFLSPGADTIREAVLKNLATACMAWASGFEYWSKFSKPCDCHVGPKSPFRAEETTHAERK